jgi:Fe2+ or Zn2+ uptake regulation protein
MSDFAKSVSETARLKILQLLRGANEYSANNEILQMGLDATGVRISASQVRAELAWLSDVGAVQLATLMGGMMVVTLTERGADIAKGTSQIEGVARPLPGAGS